MLESSRGSIRNILGPCGNKEPIYEAVEVPEYFGPTQLVVDEEKVKFFAFVMGKDPKDPGIVLDGRITPAILANDLLQMFTLKYDASQVVGLHTEEELWFGDTLQAGEIVNLSGSYTDKFERRGQGCVVMEADAIGEDGRLILRHRGTEIMRTVPGQVVGRGSAATGEGARVDCNYPADLDPVERIFHKLPPETPLVARQSHLTEPQVCLFSRAGEYVVNIHNNLPRAQEAGLARPLVQGQQLVAVLVTRLIEVFRKAWCRSGWLHVKFVNPVFAGEWVTLYGKVAKSAPKASPEDLALELWIRNQAGKVAAVGWATVKPEGNPSR